MYGTGHRDEHFNPICKPNPTLVQQLRKANKVGKPIFTIPGVIREN